jgi:hypothetical protein
MELMSRRILQYAFLRCAFLGALLYGCSQRPDSSIVDSGKAGAKVESNHATGGSDSSVARVILDSLSIIAPKTTEEFDTSLVPRDIDPSTVVTLVSDSGLVLTDINERDTTIRVSRASIAEAITKRRGRVFVSLAHFAHIYSQPYQQYSRLEFTPTPTGIDVSVGSAYLVGFLRESNGLRIARIGYYELEGD